MSNKSDDIINKDFIAVALELLGKVAINPQYEYIKVYYGKWENFWGLTKTGYIIEGALSDKINGKDIISIVNDLGKDGWKLSKIIHEGFNEYNNKKEYRNYYHEGSWGSGFKRIYRSDLEFSSSFKTLVDEDKNIPEKHYFNRDFIYILERNVYYSQLKIYLEALQTILSTEVSVDLKNKKNESEPDPNSLPIEELELPEYMEKNLEDKGINTIRDLISSVNCYDDFPKVFDWSSFGREREYIQRVFEKLEINLPEDIESVEINKLGLSTEICDYLESKNLWCIGYLIEYTYDDLLKLDDMTPDIANKIVEKLQNKFGIMLPSNQENTD